MHWRRTHEPACVSSSCFFLRFSPCSWWTNPEALTIIDTSKQEIEAGDFVVISNIKERVIEKQKGHGGWNPKMEAVKKNSSGTQDDKDDQHKLRDIEISVKLQTGKNLKT